MKEHECRFEVADMAGLELPAGVLEAYAAGNATNVFVRPSG